MKPKMEHRLPPDSSQRLDDLESKRINCISHLLGFYPRYERTTCFIFHREWVGGYLSEGQADDLDVDGWVVDGRMDV
jgi:hypothetical protein